MYISGAPLDAVKILPSAQRPHREATPSRHTCVLSDVNVMHVSLSYGCQIDIATLFHCSSDTVCSWAERWQGKSNKSLKITSYIGYSEA